MHIRAAKNNALKAIKTTNYDEIENDEDDQTLEVDENAYTIPVYSQNAPEGYSLDLFKQYKRRIDFCDRELMRVHDKTTNKKDKGSKDKGLIYVDFNAGIFEALKVNFLNCLANSFDTRLVADPKIEFYGKALERVCLDLRMNVLNHTHDVKIKVHNTKCSLDVAAQNDELGKTHKHLNDLTVGQYFATHIIANIVEIINEKVDISLLNEHVRKLALDGKKAARVVETRKNCTSCQKDVKKSTFFTCISCAEIFHVTCLSLNFSNDKDLQIKKNFTCGNCQVYPSRRTEAAAMEEDCEQQLISLKLNALLPSTSIMIPLQQTSATLHGKILRGL